MQKFLIVFLLPFVVLFAATDHVMAALTESLALGSSGVEVRTLQGGLKQLGFYTHPEITGYFGAITEKAVQQFQAVHAIVHSGTPASTGFGVVGPKTRNVFNTLMGGSPSAVIVDAPAASALPLLTKDLWPTVRDPEVATLQLFLKKTGFYTHPEITGYYGEITKAAVVAFQRAFGIPGLGGIGPETRARINSEIGQSAQPSMTIVSPSSKPAATTTKTTATRRRGGGGGGGSSGDTTVPVVSITFPADSATVSGASVTVSATASDNISISGVQFKLDGSNLSTEDTSTPYVVTWDSTGVADGAHVLTAVARDTSSNYATSTITVMVNNADATAPTVSMTAPSNGATTIGAAVTISATASDNVAVAGVQFQLDAANLGVEDTTAPFGLSWDSTAVADGAHTLRAIARDAAGNYATSSAISVTVDNATSSGSIVLDDQSVSFGTLTIAAAGGYNLVPATGTITAASITAGNGAGHWQITASGQITPTVTGDTADLASSPYTLTVAVSDGMATDTAAITINTETRTYDVRTKSELEAALAAAEALDNTADYTVYLRDDATVAGANIYGITMQGTLVDANEGATESTYDFSATSTFTGGSVLLSARTAYAPEVSAQLHILGSTGIIISGLTFTGVPSSDSYNRDDGGVNTDELAAATHYQVLVSDTVAYPAESMVIFKNNRFGGYAVNQNPLRWGQGVRVDIADTAILEDNDFDGVYLGAVFASVKRAVARRNTIERQLVDGLRAMGNDAADLTAFSTARTEFTSNTIWKMSSSTDWAGAHADGIQIGTTLDDVPFDVLLMRNYIYLPVEPVTYPSLTEERTSQGIYMDDTASNVPIDGLVAENLVVTTAKAGIHTWFGTLEIRNNTLIKDTLHQESSGNINGASVIRVNDGTSHDIHDNIADTLSAEGGTYTEHDDYRINHRVASGNSTSFYDSFNGPFSGGTYGPTWSADETSASALRASLDSIFAPKAGTLAVSRGYTNSVPDRTPAALSFGNLSGQATSTIVYAYQQITSITDGTFVVPTGLEWGVATTSDYNDVTVWHTSSSSIDNNEYLHVRLTTSASGFSTTTGAIQVGAASTTWSVGTGAGGYVATAVEYDGTNDGLTTTSFTGAAGKQGVINLWFYYSGATWATTSQRLIELRNTAGATRVDLLAATNGRLTLTLKNTANTNILNYTTTASTFNAQTWYNLLISYNLASSTFQWYKSDASVSTASATLSDDTTEAQTRAGVGSGSGGASKWRGYLADVLYHPTFLDLSDANNRRKFINASGKPVDLGADGSTPLGLQPTIYLSGVVASWQTNKGTGGGFTEVGDITAAPSSPSN